jgi:hypothetical protein
MLQVFGQRIGGVEARPTSSSTKGNTRNDIDDYEYVQAKSQVCYDRGDRYLKE